MIVDMDIEALNMNYMRGGFKPGEMVIISTPRQTVKSLYYGTIYNTNLCKEILLPMNPEPKHKFSRAKWFEAPRPGHAAWNTFSNEYHDILNWCVGNFGPHPKKPDAWSRWYMGIETVNFRDEADYILYQLRWS